MNPSNHGHHELTSFIRLLSKSNQSLSNFWVPVVYMLLLSLLLLAPFDFYMPNRIEIKKNKVRWLTETNGVEFSSVGTIRSSSSVDRLYDELVSGTGFTLEVWLATKNQQQIGPARIVSYSLNPSLRNFTLGQWQQHLVMRLRTPETTLNGTKPILYVRDVFHAEESQHIVITYTFSEQSVYVNGQLRRREPIPGGRFSNWDASHTLILGNEVTGNRPWLGKLFLVAIYNRALSEQEIRKHYTAGKPIDPTIDGSEYRSRDGLVARYIFTAGKSDRVVDQSGRHPAVDLHIPPELKVVIRNVHASKAFLSSPYKYTFVNPRILPLVIDITGHILVFVPFGFLFYAPFRRRNWSSLSTAVVAVLLGLFFTLSMESLQYLTATRTSSMTDVVHHMLGIGLGMMVAKRYVSSSTTMTVHGEI